MMVENRPQSTPDSPVHLLRYFAKKASAAFIKALRPTYGDLAAHGDFTLCCEYIEYCKNCKYI